MPNDSYFEISVPVSVLRPAADFACLVDPHFDVAPDFILIFVVVAALRQGPVAGMLWGFVAGFSQDVYAPVEWLGSQTLSPRSWASSSDSSKNDS